MTSQLSTDVDLTRPEFWQSDPYPLLAELRQRSPLYWHEQGGMPPFWAVTRYDDIVYVSKKADIFSSAFGLNMNDLLDPADRLATMVNMDDPMHKWLRALVSTGFTPARIRAMEPYIRSLATDILDGLSGRHEVDLVADITAPLPVNVIGEMLGVPREDFHLIRLWSDAIAETSDVYGEASDSAHNALQEIAGYLAAMQEERKVSPRDDLVSMLLNVEVDGRGLSQVEQIGFFVLLEFAGNETTRNTMSGAVHALSQFPAERDRVLADRSLIPSFIEESLRYGSPVIHFKRTALRDTEIRGQVVREGDSLVLLYPSGNRDPETFADPDSFDASRSPNAHVAFGGGGPHFCLGAALGRLEMRVMFEELFRRFPDLEVVGPPVRTRSNFIRGIVSMPVRLGADRG